MRLRGVQALVVAAAALAPGTASALTWSSPRTVAPAAIEALRCPSASLCVGIDGRGNVLSSHKPASGPWRKVRLDRSLSALACPGPRLCLAVDSHGRVLVSHDPAGSASTWTRRQLPGGPELESIACRRSRCVAGTGDGAMFYSTAAAGPRPRWHQVLTESNGDSGGVFTGLSCPLATLCIGVTSSTGEGMEADVFTGTPPARGFHITASFFTADFTAIACPSPSLCVAPSAAGTVVTSTDPRRPDSWQSATLHSDRTAFNAVACSSTAHCLLGDADGGIAEASNPAGGAGAWSLERAAPAGDAINALACPSAHLCLAATQRGELVAGRD